jgi:hypothetical protein
LVIDNQWPVFRKILLILLILSKSQRTQGHYCFDRIYRIVRIRHALPDPLAKLEF